MELFWLIGAIVLLFVWIFDGKVLKFDFEYYKHITKILLLGSAVALVVRSLFGVFPPAPNLSFGILLMVWWEDVMFSLLPIYYARKYLNSKISTILAIIASLAFAYGHLYQGALWAVITLLYPFYISYSIGKKHGYGTVMALHITYDVMVYSTMYLLAQMGAR